MPILQTNGGLVATSRHHRDGKASKQRFPLKCAAGTVLLAAYPSGRTINSFQGHN
jgi:hypothetical protein